MVVFDRRRTYFSSLIRTATSRLNVGEFARKISNFGRVDVAIFEMSSI